MVKWPKRKAKLPTRVEQLRAQAARFGMALETSRPGDGKRRYEFTYLTNRPSGSRPMSYTIWAIGLHEAEKVVEAFGKGWGAARGPE